MTDSDDNPPPEDGDDRGPLNDPAEVLRAAIAAANKPPTHTAGDTKRDSQTAENSQKSDNVHAHPSLLRYGKTKTTQDYFVRDDPPVRRCDPAFGAGFEFPLKPY